MDSMSQLTIKTFQEALVPNEPTLAQGWDLRLLIREECMGYVAWNNAHREIIVVDPRRDDFQEYIHQARSLKGYRTVAIVDTHMHADHISGAFEVATGLSAPLFVSKGSLSKRVHFHVTQNTAIPFQSADLEFFATPGHTQDSLTLRWGPFVFTGDTILFGDVGRDDLPTGSPAEHYESLKSLEKVLPKDVYILPGHDNKGGRLSTWATQLKVNSSLTQDREEFIRECAAFDSAAPALFKKSLVENFK
jgi:sulfur dioxygenase